jgi:hypothetical protein
MCIYGVVVGIITVHFRGAGKDMYGGWRKVEWKQWGMRWSNIVCRSINIGRGI